MREKEWIEENLGIASRLANTYLDKKLVENLFKAYTLSDSDERKELKEDIESVLSIHTPKLLFSKKPLLEIPSKEESSGQIILGNILHGDKQVHPFAVDLESLNKHLAIFGATGSGKTCLIANLLRQLTQAGISWLAIDFKRDLRSLVREGAWIVRWNWLRINPLQPPEGVAPKIWMTIVCDLFAHSFYWFSPSENYMMENLAQLYEKHKRSYPTLRELYEFIVKKEEKNRRKQEYFAVVTNRLASLLIVLKDVVDVREGMRLEEIFMHPTVLEVDQLRRDEANFLVEYILAYLFYYRMVSGKRSKLMHCTVLDEANRWFYAQRKWKETTVELGMPFIEQVPQIIRDYCEGLIFASQNCLSQTAMANTNIKLVSFLGDGEDIEAIAKSLNLSEEEKSAITKLECGEFLVAKPGLKPFIIKSQKLEKPLDKTITDEEVKQKMEPVLRVLMRDVKPTEFSKPTQTQKTQTIRLPTISEDARLLLADVNLHPFRGLSGRYKALGFSGRRAEKAKSELIQHDLAKEVKVSIGKTVITFLVPTGKALILLKSLGENVELWKSIGRVGFEHRLYQVLIAYILKKLGYQTAIEKTLDSVRLDVLAVNGKEKLGIEVELDRDVNVENKLKALKELDQLIIACKDQAVMESVRSKLNPTIPSKVRLYLVSHYLSEIKRNISGSANGNGSV